MDAELERHIGIIPRHCREGLLNYLRYYGVQPGHFLTAILSNDLAEACARADEDNQQAIYEYVFVLNNYAPREAWGSPATFEAWINRGRESMEGARRG